MNEFESLISMKKVIAIVVISRVLLRQKLVNNSIFRLSLARQKSLNVDFG